MKSDYFKQYSFGEEAKIRFTVLEQLPFEILDKIAVWFEKRETAPRFDAGEVKELSENTGEGADVISRAVYAADMLLKRMGQYGDTPENFVDDMIALKLIKTGPDSVLKFLKKLQPIAKRYYFMFLKEKVARVGSPILTGYSLTAAIKPVFEKEYEYGIDDITSFSPKLIGQAVVGNINLENGDCPQGFNFQVTKYDLDRLISNLLALQKEMLLTESQIEFAAAKEKEVR